MSLIKELQRRNVFRVSVAYVVVAWLLIQVGATLEPAMHLPEWVDSVLAFFLLLGFPVAVFFAWAYELTPEGLKRDGGIDSESSRRAVASRKWDRLIIVVLVLAVAYFAVDKYYLNAEPVTITGQEAGTNETSAVSGKESVHSPAVVSDKSIAVLPFVNMSSDEEQEYFSDGLTEELLNLLAGIDDLKVAARTSSFYYKNKTEEVTFKEIAEQLEVAHILEGSVRKGGDKIRITAQLIRADNGFHLWSETYDRTLVDVFAIQDEIAAAVVEELKVTLLGEAPHARVLNTESYELALQGRFLLNRRAIGDLEHALELFEEAIELDPNNAAAWIGVAPLYLWLFDPPRREDSRLAAEKAVELEPDNPEAYVRLGFANPAAAEELWNRAIILGPDSPLVLGVMAGMALREGDFDRTIELQRQAVNADPLHIVNIGNMASFLIEAGRWDEAEPWVERELELSPSSPGVAQRMASIRLLQGRFDEALALLPEIQTLGITLLFGEQLLLTLKANVLYSSGDIVAADETLDDFRQRYADEYPLFMAYMLAWRGEKDGAFEWLGRTLEQYPDLQKFRVLVPYLYSLHSDPRWQEVLAHFDQKTD